LFWEQTRPPLQTVPHAPQLLPSDTMFTHPVGHADSPAVQEHAPLVQLWPSAHFTLQAPQFWKSVCALTHTELQLERPAGQLTAPLPPDEEPPIPTPLPPVLPGGELVSLEQLAIHRKQPTTAPKPACMRMVVCLSNLKGLRKADSRQSHSVIPDYFEGRLEIARFVPSQRKSLLNAEPVSCRAAPRPTWLGARHFASASVTGAR
jgi:hypothetical protein